MSTPSPTVRFSHKRLIVCCDGTWMNSESGYVKGSLWKSQGQLQVPSNVTRISRCFRRKCSDGKMQIINYESGVGTGSNTLDSITGGAFGLGISERIRQAYSFICANYCDGDEIILIGFSRGAFTVRSVAGMITSLGLLTREGVDNFYPIFKDMENWMNEKYDDPFPEVPFSQKPKGAGAAAEYRARLEKMNYTRVRKNDGDLIKIKAIAVWDTVGSLGIPHISWLNKLGIYADNEEYRFWDTSLSDRVEHAFQALALDETRYPFQPAVWERLSDNHLKTDLRQVWFPGNHGNCGGGWPDQGMADITLAWMMDQLSSVGVEFDEASLEQCVHRSAAFYQNEKTEKKKKGPQWAVEPLFSNNSPIRPWALGAIMKTSSLLYSIAGQVIRSPGLYRQVDPNTGTQKGFLKDTNERVHSSVRVRLACKGLGLNDAAEWTCPALLPNWRLVKSKATFDDPVPHHPTWEPDEGVQEEVEDPSISDDGRWVWEYCGPEEKAPSAPNGRIMVEEPLGPFERHLLKMSGGTPNVYHFASEKSKD